MSKKRILTHEDIHDRVKQMARQIRRDFLLENDHPPLSIFPVPRGGVPVGYLLSAHMPVEISNAVESADLVVDDLIDSGATRKRYFKKPFYALYDKLKDDEGLGWLVFPWEQTEEKSIEDAVVRILQYIGEDPTREGLLETPGRVARSFQELYAGYTTRIENLFKVFEVGFDELVILKDIEIHSTCEHHMLPFVGKAHIAYIAAGKVIGVSKLARIVDAFSRRLQVQERIGVQVVDSLMEYLQPKGAACIIEAKHFCMCARGVAKQHSVMTTSAMRGIFLEDSSKGAAARAELIALLK